MSAEAAGTSTSGSTTSESSELKSPAPNQSTDRSAELIALQTQALSDLQRRNQMLEKQVNELRQAELVKENTVDQVPTDPTEFFKNPHQSISQLIKKELAQSVKPIMEAVQQTKTVSELDRLTAKLAEDPKLGRVFKHYKPFVEQMVQGTEVTEQNLRAAAYTVLGAISTGDIPTVAADVTKTTTQAVDLGTETPKPATPKEKPSNHIPASGAPSPVSADSTSKKAELTEDQRLAMRMFGKNPNDPAQVEDWLRLEQAGDLVDSWTQPKKDGK